MVHHSHKSNISLQGPSRSHTALPSAMNSAVNAEDSLYHVCDLTRRRLGHLPQLQPYLNLAYSSSELLSERQSLFLSQKQQQHKTSGHHSVNSVSSIDNTPSHAGTTSTLRSSAISGSSLNSLDGVTYTTSNSIPNNGSPTNGNSEEALLTYSMGILPISMDCDPVTQLSQLFQQGSPLCIVFNAVKPQYKLPIVSSDDLKICKKSIYDFILGCKEHFAFTDEELFTISDVFSNTTGHLIKVLDVVKTLLDSAPEIFPSLESVIKERDHEEEELKLKRSTSSSNEYFKIMREFVQTERKYVHDLEILDEYKQQLLDNNMITSEELYMLFPNLSEALDFQRRFLVSIEINILADPSRQRLGALFMHSKPYFKLYEPWSINQNATIDFLTANLEKINDVSFVIANKLELQSFLYKPVQRLCRYPLLLKELLNACRAQSNSVKELEMALDIAKSIARSINENQRRTENHEVVKKLYNRVVNWKGYKISKFGELLYFDKVQISTSNTSEVEREFNVYLFEKIIILFSEIFQKKSNSLSLKTKKHLNTASSLSLSTTHTNSSQTGSIHSVTEPKLDLRGRIMIINLNSVNPQSTHSLSITWESPKEQGNFILKFKNEEIRDNWSSCLKALVRRVRSESFRSTRSSNGSNFSSSPNKARHTHNSISNISSPKSKHISDVLPKHRSSQLENDSRVISETYKNSIPEGFLLIRIAYNADFYSILIDINSSIDHLLQNIKRKLNHAGAVTKVKYQDEDGDYIMLESDEDWNVAKDMLKENNELVLNVWAYS
ncbi:hypothetical protein TBLA_0A04470 [Henningerozyma blattae CBS 6284]|uniref:DH domain-containing protein n=1 Tax=Henningerozyma blattae (strain ATCC 34711 / CBS 6284 / DSM 70876 / NBRC 10599 / NRRL Y-10934 / UCD 77-7) TaxID=1071380 RepID=I2GVT9_HENB6|nr:hypothetical protein TBLA_0A04470 [Tetrapisispora blattae CBS 6284]CCH58241.1 hypothetical protein TBLA_0A04470 [Tetrapisispora blattae CBS 6284]